MVQNLPQAEGYAHQKGIYPAREAILLQQQNRGAKNASVDNIFIGNGTSRADRHVAARAAERRAMKCWCRRRTIRCGPRRSR